MRNTFRLLSWTFSVLSIVTLVQQALNSGIAAPLETLLEYYKTLVNFLFSFVDPCFKQLLSAVAERYSLNIHLHSHYKHIFILMLLYLSTDIRTNFSRKRIINATVGVPSNLIFIAIGSIGAGATPLNTSTINFQLIAFPIGSLIASALLACVLTSTFYSPPNQTWRKTFRYHLLTTAAPYFVAASIAVLIVAASQTWFVNPSLIIIGIFMLLLTLYWLVRGFWLAAYDREADENFFHRFRNAGAGRFALTMLTTLAGVLTFFLVNAAVK